MTPKDMKQWFIGDSSVRLTQAGVDNSPARRIEPGSVLVVVRSGVLKHTVPVAVTVAPVTLNQDMKALTPSAGVHAPYLARFIKSMEPTILGWVRATTADNFPVQNLLDLSVPLPPLDEQRRITAILDHADALRTNSYKSLALLRDLTAAAFQKWFGDPGSIMTRWPSKPLRELLGFLTSGSRGWARYYAATGAVFLRIQNVRRNMLDLNEIAYVDPPPTAEAKRTRIQPGDVLLSITADLGRTAVVPDDLGEAYINQHLSILRVPEVEPQYLSAFLASPAGQAQIQSRNRQGVKAGLNFNDIRSFEIPLPPRALQADYAKAVEAIVLQQAERLDRDTQLDSLKASLHALAFAGRL